MEWVQRCIGESKVGQSLFKQNVAEQIVQSLSREGASQGDDIWSVANEHTVRAIMSQLSHTPTVVKLLFAGAQVASRLPPDAVRSDWNH
jgi:hypothetical protein